MISRNPQFTTRMIVRDSIPSTADRYFSECFSAPSECHGANGGVDFMKHGGFGVPSTADRYFSECFSAPSECHGANGGVDFMKHGGFGVPSTYCNNIRGSDTQHLPPKGVNGSNEL